MYPNITLYRSNGACSFIPHTLLNEIGIPFTQVVLGFNQDVQLEAIDGSLSNTEYKKINPTGYVPALKVDGEIITEVPAIVSFICDLASDRKLLGTTNIEKAKEYEWLAWLSGTLHGDGFGAHWRPGRYTDDIDPKIVNAVTAGGYRTVVQCYERIESRLNGLYAVGEKFTAVDLNLYVFWRWGVLKLQLDMQGRFPRYTALAENVEKIESVQETLKLEGDEPMF